MMEAEAVFTAVKREGVISLRFFGKPPSINQIGQQIEIELTKVKAERLIGQLEPLVKR